MTIKERIIKAWKDFWAEVSSQYSKPDTGYNSDESPTIAESQLREIVVESEPEPEPFKKPHKKRAAKKLKTNSPTPKVTKTKRAPRRKNAKTNTAR